jgi:hypothetical protein
MSLSFAINAIDNSVPICSPWATSPIRAEDHKADSVLYALLMTAEVRGPMRGNACEVLPIYDHHQRTVGPLAMRRAALLAVFILGLVLSDLASFVRKGPFFVGRKYTAHNWQYS